MRLVWYPIGVIKSPEAAKAIAAKNGVYGKCNCCATDMAMGKTIDTAAAFVISDVSIIVAINKADNTPTGPNILPVAISPDAISVAVPDFSKAMPIAREQ